MVATSIDQTAILIRLMHLAERLGLSRRNIILLLFSLTLVCLAAPVIEAQRSRFSVQIVPGPTARAIVRGAGEPTKTWSFRDAYAGVLGLGKRIENFTVTAADRSNVPVRNIAPGQFESAMPASEFRYEVRLSPPSIAADSARVSWLNTERGLLMLADLLSVSPSSTAASDEVINLHLDLPAGWSSYSTDRSAGEQIEIRNPDRTVIAVGKHLRIATEKISGMSLTFVADGDWAFQDNESIEIASKVLRVHFNTFGSMPFSEAVVTLFPFPQATDGSQWSAETRGATVSLLMGRLPSKVAALAQLSTPLTHELFHLWVPNGLALDGDYDWFYEGFTIYQAARAAVRLDLLTFNEFLNAIARASDGYRSANEPDRLSLIDASQRRWTTGETSVYSKSFVIAFIYDLRLRNSSHGKRSLDNVYRDLFKRYSSALAIGAERKAESNGNDAAVNALTASLGSEDFVRMFVRNPVSINLSAELSPFGLTIESVGRRMQITVNEKLSKPQRDLMRQLGYNNVTSASRAK